MVVQRLPDRDYPSWNLFEGQQQVWRFVKTEVINSIDNVDNHNDRALVVNAAKKAANEWVQSQDM